MKETENKPEVIKEVKAEATVEKFKYLGRMKIKPNQRCFELDLATMKVKEVEYFTPSDTIEWGKVEPKNKKMLIRPNCDYVIKLNIKNAIKYFDKKYETRKN